MCGNGEASWRQPKSRYKSCCSYHPPLWLWNMDNLSMAYKEAKLLSHDLSEEDSQHHMTKHIPATKVLTWAFFPNIDTILMQSQLHWASHVVCMKDHCFLKKLLYGELFQGKHSQEVQKRYFKDALKLSMKSFGIAPNCLEYMAQDWDK